MKSQVKLYYSTNEKPFKLMSSKLFIVEDFENYLATFTPLILNDFQYIKDESMQISIKIIANESNIDLLKENRWKYCSIQNEDANYPRYYFINNIEWVSQGACVLSLLLDVLNTFRVGRDYSFNARTNILREHKERFVMPNRNQQTRTFHSATITDTYISDNPYTPFVFKDFRDIPYSETIEVNADTPASLFTFDEYYEEFGALPIKFTKIIITANGEQATGQFYYDNEVVFSGGLDTTRVIYGVFSSPNGLGKYLSGYLTLANNIQRIIDKNSEDINPVLFRQNNVEIITDENSVGVPTWSLVYRNQDEPSPDDLTNPVNCFLVPDIDIEVNYGTSESGRISPNDLSSGTNYMILERELSFPINKFKNSDGNSICSTTNKRGIIFRLQSGTIQYYVLEFLGGYTFNRLDGPYTTSYIDLTESSFIYGTPSDSQIMKLITSSYNYYSIPHEWVGTHTWQFSSQSGIINSINSWDKTDAKIIKIINLPYIPDDIPLVNGLLTPSGRYNVVSLSPSQNVQALQLNDLNYKWLNHLDINKKSPIEEIINSGDTLFQAEDYESKMYNSEFFIKKYVYDSFALPIIMENIDYNRFRAENPNGLMNINFYATSTINSRFAFEFAEYTCSRGDSDYYNWLIVARNNEATLYNVAYINYIRSGFNYEVKNKNISSTMAWVSFGAGVIGTIGSIIGAVYSGGIAIPMAVGLATTTAMSLANAINTTTKNERDMEQKLNQLKEQSANVMGADDFDLMQRYNGNKLLLMEYRPSEAMQDLLKKTFYYLGYKCNRYGIPETNTRESFNYLACNPVFNIFSKNFTSEIENQLELLFKNGVTYIHHRVDTGLVIDYGWDLEQTSENLEPDMRDFINNNII